MGHRQKLARDQIGLLFDWVYCNCHWFVSASFHIAIEVCYSQCRIVFLCPLHRVHKVVLSICWQIETTHQYMRPICCLQPDKSETTLMALFLGTSKWPVVYIVGALIRDATQPHLLPAGFVNQRISFYHRVVLHIFRFILVCLFYFGSFILTG